MAAAWPVLKLGLLHMRPIQFWLKQRDTSAAWCHGRHRVTVTRACVSALTHWRDPFWLKQGVILDTAHIRKVVTTDASNKCWGALCEGKPTFGPWSEDESGLNINCLEMLAVSGLSILTAGHSGTPRANTLRQQIRGVIHKLPGWPHLEVTLHAGERPSCMGSEQSALTEGDACAGQYEPRSTHVVKEQCLFRGMDTPPTRGSENLGNLWQGSSRPLRLQGQLSLPNLFYKEHGCPGPRMAQPSTLCFPRSCSATADTQASQGTMAQADSNSPPLEEPTVGAGVIPPAESSSMGNTLETGPPLSRARSREIMIQSVWKNLTGLQKAKS